MGEKILGFMGNDTPFGRIMTRIWIVVAGNLLFLLFSIPVITIGASYCGLNYLMLKAHKEDGEIYIFKTFWKGFKENFKQGTIAWIITALLAVFGYIDIQVCKNTTGPISTFRYPILAMGILLLILVLYLFPVIVSFQNRLPMLAQHACYFAFRNPIRALLLAAMHVICWVFTYMNESMTALFAFIWFFFGFGLLAYITAGALVKDFTSTSANTAADESADA